MLQSCLGDGYERQMTFTNLLRAAGLFAKDDDGYFVRYGNANTALNESLLTLPQPNYLITFPVPVEPRMRIAYNVFAGLLLKYLYQTYAAVPTEVMEGMAQLEVLQPLPNSAGVWSEFKQSGFVAKALAEGFAATLDAATLDSPSGIGGIDMTDAMADSALLQALLAVLPRFSNKFQTQGGMRINFYRLTDAADWLAQQDDKADSSVTVADLWKQGWEENSSAKEIAARIARQVVSDLDRGQPLPMQTFKNLWKGEGSGTTQKIGRRDGLSEAKNETEKKKAKEIDDQVIEFLGQLDAKRRGTDKLHQWVKSQLNTAQGVNLLNQAIASIQTAVTAGSSRKPATVDATSLVSEIAAGFQAQAIIPALRRQAAGHNREVLSAIQQTVGLCFALQLAARLDENFQISIFGWRAATLRRVPAATEWTLRFLKKRKPDGAKRFLEVKPFGDIERVVMNEAEVSRAPFQCFAFDRTVSVTPPDSLLSAQRCMVCGSALDLLAGAKSFLPEAKKRHYETPTRDESPSLCSNCAFIAYMSSIYPSSDMSIVEFPADNFLELFALYESLQGVSALVALKYVNRVASMSVLPNRYLLLSHRDGKGRMDGKAQVYLQLREQTHLLKYVDRPMRVQIEGGIPQMWSEILPHVPIGLSHFKELPPHYETQDSARKGFAYEAVRALQKGQPYKALYIAARHAETRSGEGDKRPSERQVLSKSLKAYEEFAFKHSQVLAQSLGGENVSDDIYRDIADFSNYLFDLLHPLVRREAQKSGSSISGISRKYTDLVLREFGEGLAGKFLYTVCQEVDAAERDGDGWLKHQAFIHLYGGRPDTKGKSDEERAKAWEEFRQTHPVLLEVRLSESRSKHGTQHAIWQKFLREVQARTLALLMLNVRRNIPF
jgi:hypothetical protein